MSLKLFVYFPIDLDKTELITLEGIPNSSSTSNIVIWLTSLLCFMLLRQDFVNVSSLWVKIYVDRPFHIYNFANKTYLKFNFGIEIGIMQWFIFFLLLCSYATFKYSKSFLLILG